jgi:ribosomal protein S18 acetylase RimI-like enzyme
MLVFLARAATMIINTVKPLGMESVCCYLYHNEVVDPPGDRPDPTVRIKDGTNVVISHVTVPADQVPDRQDQSRDEVLVQCSLDGEVIGRARMCFGEKYVNELATPVHFDGWYVYDVYVSPEHRQKGVVTAVFEECKRIAASSGRGSELFAFVHFNNFKSQRSLASSGFRHIRTLAYLNVLGFRVHAEKSYDGKNGVRIFT